MTAYDPAQVHLAGQLDDMEARARKAETERDRLATQALHFRERAITAEAAVARVEALRDSWITSAARDECRCGGCDGCTARVMALELRAALGGES